MTINFDMFPYWTAWSSFACGIMFYVLLFVAIFDKYYDTGWTMPVAWIATPFISINWFASATWLAYQWLCG